MVAQHTDLGEVCWNMTFDKMIKLSKADGPFSLSLMN